MKQRTLNGFGQRLTQIRRSRGLTQTELGEAAGVSDRVIAYYEHADAQPPGAMLTELAQALRVSTDELLGLKTVKEQTSAKTARLLKRLQQVEELPPADQRALFKFLDALLDSRGVRQSTTARRAQSQKRKSPATKGSAQRKQATDAR